MGSFAAERMARAGLRVGLFEKDAMPGDSTVCAGGMHYDLIRFLELPLHLIEKTLPTFRVTINGRRSEWTFAEPTYATIERRHLDRFLADRAIQSGATLVTQARVVEVMPRDGLMWFEFGPTRERRQAAAQVFIFADGPHSLADRTLTPKTHASNGPEYVGIEYDLDAPGNDLDALEIIPDPVNLPFGYLWVFPKRDHVNVGLARLSTMQGPPLKGLLDQFIDARADLRERRILARKGGVIPAALRSTLQKDNCLVIGDAAGMINPLTGGGYVCGFVSAALAAKTCIEAFRGGTVHLRILPRYRRRLQMTKHHITIRLANRLLRGLVAVHHVSNAPLYLPLLRLYFHVVHIAMRWVPVM
jgi:digeranylgeranylglycerophospholipid reductase